MRKRFVTDLDRIRMRSILPESISKHAALEMICFDFGHTKLDTITLGHIDGDKARSANMGEKAHHFYLRQ